MQFKTVSRVAPSPDGSKVVWTQSQSVMDAEQSETLTHIFLANADGAHRLQLTRGEKSATSPSFAPDGKSVYFMSARSGKNNVYRIAIAGGEAEMLTDFKGPLGAYQVSPDGKMVAFTGYEPPPMKRKIKRKSATIAWWMRTRRIHRCTLFREAPADEKGSTRKLTDGKRHVTEFSWSPDSSKIAFSHWAAPGADNWTQSAIAEIEVSSGTVKAIAPTHAFGGSRPAYSPDGRYLAFRKIADGPSALGLRQRDCANQPLDRRGSLASGHI